jgi:hypothetical protein
MLVRRTRRAIACQLSDHLTDAPHSGSAVAVSHQERQGPPPRGREGEDRPPKR